MNAREVLAPFLVTDEGGVLAGAEVAAAEMVCRQSSIDDGVVALSVALAVWAHRSGHSCVELDTVGELLEKEVARSGSQWPVPDLPSGDEFRAALHGSPAVREIESKGTSDEALADARPLVLLDGRLYSQRQFADELSVAESLHRLRSATFDPPSEAALELIDAQLTIDGDDDRQNAAARAVLSRGFTVLTGGPGTGKTHTLTRILLAFLVDAADRGEEVSVAVCAPTGKAAARADELLRTFIGELAASADPPAPEVLEQLRRITPSTVHRLLRRRRGSSTRFTHDREHPLPHDLVIVDETSMVPLQLMARLLEAIGPDTRVLLVGDDAQLESVESGSVLRDLVAASDRVPGSVHSLTRVRRVAEEDPIAAIAPLVRDGHGDEALGLIAASAPKVRFIEVDDGTTPPGSVIDALVDRFIVATHLAGRRDRGSHREALSILAANRLLCGARRGPLGIEHWNDAIDTRLRLRSGDWSQPGRAVLVTVNAPRVDLVNGDVGIVVRRGETLEVAFDSSEELDGGVRYVSLVDLPTHERAFAMTVHKSQGSEYSGELVVMLPQLGSPLLTRELIYTGLTRAAGNVTLVGSKAAFVAGVDNPSIRVSGLARLLD